MFTIEVKKKGKDEKFGFEDAYENAKVIHEDCYGGKASWKRKPNIWGKGGRREWSFFCGRCGGETEIDFYSNKPKTIVVQTAIDGEERKISDDVRVIQRT